jgi:hypothetical protein
LFGLYVQLGGSVQLALEGTLTTNDNAVGGVGLWSEVLDVVALEASGNGYAGVLAEFGSDVNIDFGQIVDGMSSVRLDESSICLSNSNIGEVYLDFGSRASFDGGNTIGAVYCDGTELIRGDAWCSKEAVGVSGIERPQVPLLDGPFSMEHPTGEPPLRPTN